MKRTAKITPAAMGRRVVFENRCSCRLVNCNHLAATAFAALDRFPVLRRAEQATFFGESGGGACGGAPAAAGESGGGDAAGFVFCELQPGGGADGAD